MQLDTANTEIKCIRKNKSRMIGIGDQRLKGIDTPGGHVLSSIVLCVAQTTIGLKLDGGVLRTGLRAAAAASASCFAARRAALLFVLGGILGGAMLLRRGLGLAVGATVVAVMIFSDDLEVTAEGLASPLAGRVAATEAGRLTAY